MDRRDKALRFVDLSGRGLEIGPSYNPLVPKSSGARIETVDHDDQQALVAKYTGWGLPAEKIAAIEPVDHIWAGGPLTDVITEHGRFDYIIASHFLEHTVDMVAFLRDCDTLLTDSGRLALVLPDKRYCFDRFQPLSTVGDVVDAAHADYRFHTAGTLLDHQAYACTRDGQLVWSRTSHGPLTAQFPKLEDGAQVIAAGLAQDEYHDIHHWKFTPRSFRLLMHDLAQLGYHRFGPVGEYPTEGFEFFITLGKGVAWPPVDRCEELQRIEAELAETSQRVRGPRGHQLEQAQAEIDAMRNSHSWRVTKPLRRAHDVITRFRRQSRRGDAAVAAIGRVARRARAARRSRH